MCVSLGGNAVACMRMQLAIDREVSSGWFSMQHVLLRARRVRVQSHCLRLAPRLAFASQLEGRAALLDIGCSPDRHSRPSRV